jgi:hypothetical protein
MLRKIIVFGLFIFTGCTGWDEGSMLGTLTVKKQFEIDGYDRNLVVTPGKHEIALDFNYGTYAMSDPSLTVTYLKTGKSYSFAVPRASFDEDSYSQTVNATSDDLNQDFAIKGSRVEQLINSWTQNKSRGCSKCDVCLQQVIRTDSDGYTSTNAEFTYSCTCPGVQDVEYLVKEYKKVYVLKFLSKANEALATFKSSSQSYTRESVNKILGVCR